MTEHHKHGPLVQRQHSPAQECDACHRTYETEPVGSFQTPNGTWFCSIECGRRAGW